MSIWLTPVGEDRNRSTPRPLSPSHGNQNGREVTSDPLPTFTLPPGLPVPTDDGAADHLRGREVADVTLVSSDGEEVNLAALVGTTVVYVYPMSSSDTALLPDNWDSIPGARGCTPQHCNMRDHYAEVRGLGAGLFGLATQPPAYLRSETERLHLPYPLLSDEHLAFTEAMRLPTLEVEVAGTKVLKRTTLLLRDGVIAEVFYPVFPPDRASEQVLAWLRANPSDRPEGS